jgi:hypothetical protein
VVISILKPGKDRSLASTYRPIRLTSFFLQDHGARGKLLTRLGPGGQKPSLQCTEWVLPLQIYL